MTNSNKQRAVTFVERNVDDGYDHDYVVAFDANTGDELGSFIDAEAAIDENPTWVDNGCFAEGCYAYACNG